MPELPEVETIRRDLEPLVLGRRIESVAIHPGGERVAITHAPRELEGRLRGRAIERLGRHGKYLLVHLDDDRTWVVHLRMSGLLLVRPYDAPAGRFERGRIDFDDGSGLRFEDYSEVLPDLDLEEGVGKPVGHGRPPRVVFSLSSARLHAHLHH